MPWEKVQLVAPLAPGETESQEDESPEVTEKVGLKVAAAEALLLLLVVDDAVDLVEVAEVVTDDFPDAVLDLLVMLLEVETTPEETVLETTLVDDEETALPERVPEMTLLPEPEGEPREVFNQHVP